jgi:hypothetical protein
MHTDKYAMVRCFLNKKYTLFTIESIHFCPGYATLYLTWNTYIYNYNLDVKSHQEAHKIRICSPELSSWEMIRNFNWCLCYHICVHISCIVHDLTGKKFSLIHCLLTLADDNFELLIYTKTFIGPSWSWSYDSWIYNYLCNQCISLL